ncbi:MAG TPA: (d)CMP kinase [Thermoanaerobaculia bacterium]|nr:(d)CMP kinase [Thermoanaerobaculia bacterium]
MAVIVAIDGPSGVGKSTASRRVAEVLRLPHIDTGAMYRAIALRALREDVDLADAPRLEKLAAGSHIELRKAGGRPRVLLDGEDVTEAIRAPRVSMAASAVSAVPEVRRVLVRLQQEMGHREGGVLEGRDIGTKVFPETPHKFFLTARPEIRAGRRHRELEAGGVGEDPGRVMAEMLRRDEQDSTRSDSPLRYDESYVLIDTSDLTIDEVVERIVTEVVSRVSPRDLDSPRPRR